MKEKPVEKKLKHYALAQWNPEKNETLKMKNWEMPINQVILPFQSTLWMRPTNDKTPRKIIFQEITMHWDLLKTK